MSIYTTYNLKKEGWIKFVVLQISKNGILIRSLGIWVLLFFVTTCFAQLGVSGEKAAQKNILKKRWEKAESKLRKALRKDPSNVLARYIFAQYFFSKDNPSFQLDSAYRYTLSTLEGFRHTTQKEREKMRRFALDSAAAVSLREKIDSAAFEVTRKLNTENGFIRFLKDHPFSGLQAEAVLLRNEVAYQQAVKENTYSAFLNFLDKYPQATRAAEARQKYDQLLYESLTKDKRLSSFENFLRLHPETPFRNEIERNIFEQATMAGTVSGFQQYLQRYPKTRHAAKAKDLLFHLLLEKEEPDWPNLFLTDSLQNILQLQESFLIPFLKQGRFGFMDKNGREIISPTLNDLREEYRCGNVTEDLILTTEGILARNGQIIYTGTAEEVADLGSGFLKIRSQGCFSILHKSGVEIRPCVADAKVLGGRFITFLTSDRWTLYALSGRRLLSEEFDEIAILENVIVLKKDSVVHLLTVEHLLQAAEEQKTPATSSFSDVRLITHGLLLATNKKQQGILDQKLTAVIPFDTHELSPQFFGILGKSSPAHFSIYDSVGHPASSFQKVIFQEPWLAVKSNALWMLMNPVSHGLISDGYDSLKFEGPFALGVNEDTLSVHFDSNRSRTFIQAETATFIPGKDSTSFLMIGRGGNKTIFNRRGNLLFSGSFDDVQFAGRDLFIVSKKEKKGLVNLEGKPVLPLEYNAIGSENNQVISLLKSMKFGLYHVATGKLIKPQYDKNLTPYTGSLVVAFRDGLYGFIDWNNKPSGNFEFEEIRYWNDTAALVRQNQLWNIMDVNSKEILESDIQEIRMIRDLQDEKLAIVKQRNSYGVLSNRRGAVIPVSFSDLVNVGPADDHFYFTEKHVEEAAIFVVIYYDKAGKLVRREVYEEAEDYEKIYCSDN